MRSMRARLTVAFALAGAVFMALLTAAVFLYSRQAETTQLARLLEDHARQYRADLAAGKGTPKHWDAFLHREAKTLNGARLTMIVMDKNEDIVGRTQRSGQDWPHSGNWLVETVNYEGYTLVLAAPWHSPGHDLHELMRKLGLVSVIVVLMTALGAWLLVGRVLSPIGALSRQARAASELDPHASTPELSTPSDDAEVLELVGTLNGMLDNMTQTTLAKGRFYAAASHELRTPLQGLSALLEFGLAHPRKAEEWQVLAQDAFGQSRQLIELTNDLLALNQLEMASARPQLGIVDAADLIERMLAARATLIAERGLILQVSLPDDADLLAPWNHLEMLLRNLLDNAIKYATPGTELRVTWQPGQFTVWNAVALSAQTDIEQWFEPFFRDDTATRSAVDGNGLGLAICRAICHANGWSLTLESSDGGVLAVAHFDVPPDQAKPLPIV